MAESKKQTRVNLAERGRSALKGVEEPQNWGALGLRPLAVGVANPCKYAPSPHVLSCRIWSF